MTIAKIFRMPASACFTVASDFSLFRPSVGNPPWNRSDSAAAFSAPKDGYAWTERKVRYGTRAAMA